MIGKLPVSKIDLVLKENILGRIGCSYQGKTYIVPTNYVYDGKNIICHSLTGMKIDMMRKNPSVCFEVEDMKSMTEWKTVILQGQFQELTDETDRYKAMKLLVDKMLRLKISESAVLPERAEKRMHPRSPGALKPVIYRIIVTEKTGRFEKSS